jgi:hypothetical protein
MSELVGVPRLGVKESSTQQPGRLGDEFDLLVGEQDDATDMFITTNGGRVRVKWLRNTGATPIPPGAQVKRDTAGNMSHDVVIGTAAAPACAIADPYLKTSIAQGEKFLGIIEGEVDVLVSAAIAKGATIGTAANGKVATNALGAFADSLHACGVMIEAATADGQLRKAVVDFRVLK